MPTGGLPQDAESFEAFLADVYANLRVLVVRLTSDGVVLSINPAVIEVTGYGPADLLGRNWWGIMFPGKLFAQVPKFISPTGLNGLLHDHPMVLRRKDGKERTVAWTRFVRELPGQRKEIVCVGQDLTDRLIKADLEATDVPGAAGSEVEVGMPPASVPTDVEGDVVMPLAISPPMRSGDNGSLKAIQEVHEFLSQIDTRATELEKAFSAGEVRKVADLALAVELGAHACGLLDVTLAAERVHEAAAIGSIDAVSQQVQGLLELCKKTQHR